jgi:threonine dehydrogenase-like Zn-dependent dehydrogenase
MVAKTAHAKAMLVEPLANRQEYGRKLGADWIVDPTKGSLKEQVMDLTDGRGGTVVVEASGNDNAIASIFDVAAHSARVRLIGHSIGRKVPVEIGLTIWKTLSITGSGGTKNFGQRTIRFMDQIRDMYDVRSLITHRFNFSDLHDAFDVAVNNKAEAIKVMLNMD